MVRPREDLDIWFRIVPQIPGGRFVRRHGPEASGIFIDTSNSLAVLRNPTKGGVYQFDAHIPDGQQIPTQAWLPISGPDVSADFQREIGYIVTNWGPRYHAAFDSRFQNRYPLAYLDPAAHVAAHLNMKVNDLLTFALHLDFATQAHLEDICGLAHIGGGTNFAAGDRERFALSGEARRYVVDFAKRSNMGYAMVAAEIGLPESLITSGPDLYRKWVGNEVGTKDSAAALQSYAAGLAIVRDGRSLASVMDEFGRSMQEPHMRARKEWPNSETAPFTHIVLANEAPWFTKNKMERLTIPPP